MYGTFTLTGRHTTPSGKAHAGSVVVTPNATIRDTAGDVVMSGAEQVKLDETGAWSIVLPCDSPGLNPSEGIGYTVGYSLYSTSMGRQSFYATADMAGSTLDVSEIVTVAVPTPLSAIVGPQGDPGPAGADGADGAKGDKGDPGDTAFKFDTDGTPYYGATPSANTRITTEATVASGYAIQRLDRQNVSAARTGGGKSTITYTDALEFVEDWADLTDWASAQAQVSGNRYFATSSATPTGVLHAFPVAANETAHITGLLYWKAGGAAPAYFGIDVGAAGHAPATASPEGMFLGFNGSNARAIFKGASTGASVVGLNLIGSNPTVDTTYSWSIDVGENYVSLSMHALDSSSDSATAYISRAAITSAGKAVNNIALYLGDARALAGHSFGPVVAVKSRQQTRTKIVAGISVESVEHRQTVTASATSGDLWRYSIPASYDARTPSPVVIYCHQSLTGSQHVPWSESRAQPVTKALLDAGYIVAAANDGGDRWGNQASLDNYLALYRHLRDSFNTGPLLLLGVSMGGMVALNALTHAGWPTPAAVATIGGVVSLDDLWADNTGAYAAGIRTAYGIASDGSDYEAKTAGYNPADRAGADFRGVPFRLYTSTGDTTVPKTSNQDVLAAKVAGYSPEANVVLGSGAHLDASQFQASDLVSFFNAYR